MENTMDVGGGELQREKMKKEGKKEEKWKRKGGKRGEIDEKSGKKGSHIFPQKTFQFPYFSPKMI